MLRFVISSGHGLKVRGASGYLDEVDEAREVVEQVATVLRSAGFQVVTFHDDTSTSQDQNLKTIVSAHNKETRDWDVSVHFNAYQTTSKPMGSEVLYVSNTGQTMARTVVDKICTNGFVNRGPKERTDLYFLNNTEEPAVLLEVCFVDSKADADLYNAKFLAICHSIAEGLAGKKIGEMPEPPVPQPPEPWMAEVAAIAMDSEIAKYSWRDRGVAPTGYIQGFALTWAQVVRKFYDNDLAVEEMARASSNNPEEDVLAWYEEEFENCGMANAVDGLDTLRHLFALLLGLGMRETSGQHCCGRDTSADNTTSDTAEAGLYQTSYNAHVSSPEFDVVMNQYAAGEWNGFIEYFRKEVECSESNWECYGSGRGYDFQRLVKSKPALAVETCALTLRNLRQHYGPINRREAELKREAEWMLLDVQRYLSAMV